MTKSKKEFDNFDYEFRNDNEFETTNGDGFVVIGRHCLVVR